MFHAMLLKTLQYKQGMSRCEILLNIGSTHLDKLSLLMLQERHVEAEEAKIPGNKAGRLALCSPIGEFWCLQTH